MRTLTTISRRELKVSSNKSKKTFTIRTESAKYRTLPMSREDFEHANRNWTGNDWQQFLKTDEYVEVR
jgi:hypothetical protein